MLPWGKDERTFGQRRRRDVGDSSTIERIALNNNKGGAVKY